MNSSLSALLLGDGEIPPLIQRCFGIVEERDGIEDLRMGSAQRRIWSDMQTMEVESIPPLNSARTGSPVPVRRAIAVPNTERKCSS